MLEGAAACRGVARGPRTAVVEDWSTGAAPADSSRPSPVARTEQASGYKHESQHSFTDQPSQTLLKRFIGHVTAGRTIIIHLWSILNGDPPRNINRLLYNANPFWNFCIWGVTSQVRSKWFSQCWNRLCFGLTDIFINRCGEHAQIALYYMQNRRGSHYTCMNRSSEQYSLKKKHILCFLVNIIAHFLNSEFARGTKNERF